MRAAQSAAIMSRVLAWTSRTTGIIIPPPSGEVTTMPMFFEPRRMMLSPSRVEFSSGASSRARAAALKKRWVRESFIP